MHLHITDPVYDNGKSLSALDKFFMRYIADKRDLPFVYLSLQIVFVLLPAAALLFVFKDLPWYCYAGYFFLYLHFLGPYVLMLHNTCHRKFFKKQYAGLVKFHHWFLGLFFGQTIETYFHHHIAMHHVENNLDDDLSSTMKFRRDRIGAFCQYLVDFYVLGAGRLVGYFRKRLRQKFALKVLFGELGSLLIFAVFSFVNFKAALFVFIIPIVVTRFAMMAGNWAQHAFIDPANPENIYRNSITCINTGYNKKCFNDGYHIGHHLRPGMHWTEMPVDFQKNIDKYIENDAIVFRGLDYFQVWFLLMTKNYGLLAKRYVSLTTEPRQTNEIKQLLKNRIAKINSTPQLKTVQAF